MKKIISAAFGVALFLASAAPSFAANSVRIIDTGSQSLNFGAIVKLRRTTVDNPQTANVTNNVTTNTTSGGNEVKNNTKVLGDISSGKADSLTDVYTDVNNSDIEVNGCGCDEDTRVKIDQTGYKSLNVAVVVDVQSITVNNKQDARVINNVTSNTNSGGNVTKNNTKIDGGVSSGNAVSVTNVATFANTSTIKISP